MKTIGVLVLWIALTFVAPAIGFRAKPDEWFRSLTKRGFNPPSWVFAPVWTTLYLLMAMAAWLVWRQGGWERQTFPLSLYLFQLVLNAGWTPLFFGAHRIGLALSDIVLQMARDRADAPGIFTSRRGRRLALRAVSRLGQFRNGAELCLLARNG